jgi:exosortase A-associated hydrolase 1
MGDSEGESRTFEDIDDDIRCAIDQFHAEVPELREVVIWGLCDAASAALFYAHRDSRITGLVLLNPWARTEQGAAKAYLKHYYLQRLVSREFWTKVFRFRFDAVNSVRSLIRLTSTALPSVAEKPHGDAPSSNSNGMNSLPDRMLAGLQHFRGPVLFILSGNDLTAREFMDCTKASAEWRKLLASPRAQVRHLADANHTFARLDWQDEVAILTCDWIVSW